MSASGRSLDMVAKVSNSPFGLKYLLIQSANGLHWCILLIDYPTPAKEVPVSGQDGDYRRYPALLSCLIGFIRRIATFSFHARSTCNVLQVKQL